MKGGYKLTTFKTDVDVRVTPGTIQYENLYRRIGVYPGWRNRRVEQLVKRLGCPIQDLLAMCGEFNFNVANKAVEKDCWPPHLSLHFALLEAALAPKEAKPEPIMRPEFLNYGSPTHT